jgi:hypothetical protein
VVAVLAVAMTVAAASIRTVSVKVPPISMASRRGCFVVMGTGRDVVRGWAVTARMRGA